MDNLAIYDRQFSLLLVSVIIPQWYHPPVEKPLAMLGNGVVATQAALSKNNNFGNRGVIFIGEFGTAESLTQEMPGIKHNI